VEASGAIWVNDSITRCKSGSKRGNATRELTRPVGGKAAAGKLFAALVVDSKFNDATTWQHSACLANSTVGVKAWTREQVTASASTAPTITLVWKADDGEQATTDTGLVETE